MNTAVAVINQVIIAIAVTPLISSVLEVLEVGGRTMHEAPDLAWPYGHVLRAGVASGFSTGHQNSNKGDGFNIDQLMVIK